MVTQPLIGAAPWTSPQRLRRVQQAQLVGAAKPFPLGLRVLWWLDAIGGTPQRERLHVAVHPPGEVTDAGIGPNDRSLRRPRLWRYRQTLLTHPLPASHTVPHVPQLALSVSRFVQTPPQFVRPL